MSTDIVCDLGSASIRNSVFFPRGPISIVSGGFRTVGGTQKFFSPYFFFLLLFFTFLFHYFLRFTSWGAARVSWTVNFSGG